MKSRDGNQEPVPVENQFPVQFLKVSPFAHLSRLSLRLHSCYSQLMTVGGRNIALQSAAGHRHYFYLNFSQKDESVRVKWKLQPRQKLLNDAANTCAGSTLTLS